MKEIGHLVHLEQELEEDLEEARRLIRRGRHDAIAELDAHAPQLGKLRMTAGDVIERYAHDAEEGLRLVRSRLGELHLLLTKQELRNLEILDHFRDRVVEAMEFAEGDMEDLKQRGDEWSSRENQISEAWNQLSRRLSLVRMHLVQEVETVSKEFGAERYDVLSKDDGSGGRAQPVQRAEISGEGREAAE